MATKTFEELKQLAIQIRDEKTNKQNTATRVGTAMLEHINKLEQDYYDKNQTDEELKERDDKLTELEEYSEQIGNFIVSHEPISYQFYKKENINMLSITYPVLCNTLSKDKSYIAGGKVEFENVTNEYGYGAVFVRLDRKTKKFIDLKYGAIGTWSEYLEKDRNYMYIPVFVHRKNDCIYNVGGEVRLEKSIKDILRIDKQITINIDGTKGVYQVNNKELNYLYSESWKYKIIPISEVENVKTYAGAMIDNSWSVPAIIYLKDKNITTNNILFGYEEYGSKGTSIPDIKEFYGVLKQVEGATHVLVNSYVGGDLDDSYINTNQSIDKRVSKNTYEIEQIKNKLGEYNTYVVRKNNNKENEYTTIADALSKVSEGDCITIYDGTYIENHLIIPKGIRLKGIGNVVIQGELPDNADVNNIRDYSTLECNYGASLENITVTAKNLRYPIHADFSNGTKAIWNIKNCRFIHYGNESAYNYRIGIEDEINANKIFTACSAWGGGTYGGDTVYCEDCYFESVGRAFSTHNNIGDTYTILGESYVKLVNCELVSKGINRDGRKIDYWASLFIQNLDCPVQCNVVLSNCKLNGFILMQNSGASWTNKLYMYNCTPCRLYFSGYGTGESNLDENIQISLYESEYNEYPIQDGINKFRNVGNEKISAGYAVKENNAGVELLKSEDESNFFGISLEDIEPGDMGDIQYSGYISRIYLQGIRTKSITINKPIYIQQDGSFSTEDGKEILRADLAQNIFIGRITR